MEGECGIMSMMIIMGDIDYIGNNFDDNLCHWDNSIRRFRNDILLLFQV